jgi:hypothetical protein
MSASIEDSGILDDDLDLEDDGTPPPEPQAEPEPSVETEDQKELKALRATVAGLEGKTALLDQLGPLLPSVKAALEKFGAPEKPGAPDTAQLAALGEKLQTTLLTGKPEEAAQMLIDLSTQIANRRVDSEIQRVGTPLADRAGDWTLSSYLNAKAAENPNGERVHKLVAKELALTDQEKAWVGSAPAKDVRQFLDARYEQAAGKVLLRSSKAAKPRDLSGAGGGGASRSGSPLIPGLSAREQREQERLAEIWYPDTPDGEGQKKRIAHLKAVAAQMKEAG